MGNGAGTHAHQSKLKLNEFKDCRRIESLSKHNYFINHREDFFLAVQSAIQTQKLDCLEMLIAAGGIEEVRPLHLATLYKSFESMEVLLSAGMNPYSIDDNGRTPLHCICLKEEFDENISLILTLLYSCGKKAIYMVDAAGDTPIHCAVTSKNLDIIKVLFECGGSMMHSVPNKTGQSARAFAHRLGYFTVVNVIDKYRSISSLNDVKPSRQLSKSPYKNDQKSQTDAPVDMERIMLVWETFFENAMKSDPSFVNESKYSLSDDDDTYSERKSRSSKGNNGSKGVSKSSLKTLSIDRNTSTISIEKSYGKKSCINNNDLYHSITSAPSQSYMHKLQCLTDEEDYDNRITKDYSTASYPDNSNTNIDIQPLTEGIVDWFQWILLQIQLEDEQKYEEMTNNEEENACETTYYVLNRETGQTKWLDNHLWEQSQYYGIYQNFSKLTAISDISTVVAVISNGWIMYYDATSNCSSWLHLHTNTIENFLPIGQDPSIYSLNLYPYNMSDYADWVASDQLISLSWQIVICPNETYETSDVGYNFPVTSTADGYGSKWDLWEKGDTVRGGSVGTSSASDAKEDMGYKRAKGRVRVIGKDSGDESRDESGRSVEGNPNLIYYYNTITGQSSWVRPGGWEALLTSTGGWVRCYMEGNEEGYWWHEESGAVSA